MRSAFRTLPVFALVCLPLVMFAAPVRAHAQNAQQDQTPHPITSLPLPPDEVETPSAKPAPAIAPSVTPAPTPAPKSKPSRHGKTPAPVAPSPTVIIPVKPAPSDASSPSLVVITPETPAPAAAPATKSKRGKKLPASAPPVNTPPAPAANDAPHAITGLPLPPDEAPATAPATRPVPASTPKPVITPKPAITPEPKKPAPTKKLAAPAPTPAVTKPEAPTLPPTPPTSAPKTVVVPETPASKPEPSKPAPVKIEPIVPVTPPAPVKVPEEPKATAPTVVTPPPTAVKPEPVVPRTTPKVVVTPPTPKLKPRNAAPEKPTTVTLPAQPTTTLPLDTVNSSAPAPDSSRRAPAPSGTVSTIAPSPVPEGTLGAIVFQGADPFTADELTPITGLSLGTTPSEEALQKASRALIDTGYFYNVSATFGSVAKVGTATFILQPAPPEMLRRLSFANFVWLTPAEIEDVLKRVPLYHGYGSVPATNNGPLIASIQAALSRALTTKGVNAMITHSDVPPNALHSYAAIEFRVTEPRVVLDSASLFDIPPSLVAKTLKAQELAVKQPYNEGIAGTTLTDLLLRPARDAGYIGAKLWRIDRKRRAMGNNVGVIFTARMDAGPLYTVRSLGWVPTPVYSSTDFHRNAGLMAGKPPTPAGLEKTQQSILDAYRSHGYVDAVVLVNSDLDAKSGGASYTFSVNPGPQYTLKSISIQGLPPDVQKEFEAAWTVKPGDVYDEEYLLNFINDHPNIKSLKAYTFDYNRSSVPDSHMIDLVITFKPAK